MAVPRAAQLTSDELKAYLLNSLQGRGVLDSLKSQLRNKLATELQKAIESPESGNVRAEPTKPTMPVYFANSIIARHLKQMGYEYTLSIFLPEAEVNIDKLPTHSDILHFVRASPSSRLYAELEQNKDEQGFLVQLLEALPALLAAPTTHSAAAQTDQQFKNDRSIYDKLQALEVAYGQKAEEELAKCQEHLEERIVSVQLECEQQYKKQLQAELAHFRERELSEMRLEEKNKSRHELTRLRAELESAYRQRSEAVRKMELEMMERMKHKEQELERGIHVQRQSLLEELEGLKEKKAELDRTRTELEKRGELGRLQEEHTRKMADQLESHKSALQAMQEQSDKLAEEKARRCQIEYERNHQARSDGLSRKELKLSDYDRLVGKTAELEGLLHTASMHQVTFQQEKEALVHKLSEVASLQQKLFEAERQLSDMRKQETGYLQTIKELQSKLGAHQKQVDKAARVQAKELQALELENQNLRIQLDTQCQYNLELQKRLDDQTLQLRTTQRELKDLQEQIEHLQAALKSTYRPAGLPLVKKHTKARFPDPHHTSSSPLNLTKSSGHHHTSKSDGDNDRWKSQGKGGHEIELTDAFLVESKSTFARLEKEAQELERSFQHLGLGYDPVTPRSPGPRLRAQFQTSPWHSPPTHLTHGHLQRTPERVPHAAASMATSFSPAFPLISAVPYPAVTPQTHIDVAVESAISSFPFGTRTLPPNSPPRATDHAHTPLMMDLPSHYPVTASHSVVAPQPSPVNGQPFLGQHTPVMTSHHLGDVKSSQHFQGVTPLLPSVQQCAADVQHHTNTPPPSSPTQILSHVTTQLGQLTSHVTTQPAQVTSRATTQPAQVTSRVTTQPAQVTSHVTTQPAQVTSHVTTQPAQMTSHVTTKPFLLPLHHGTIPPSSTLPSQLATLPPQVTSQVTTLPPQLTSQLTTLPSQVTTLPSQVTTLPSQVTTLPPQLTSQVTILPPQVTTHVTTSPPSDPLPVSSQPLHFLPAVPAFNLNGLWKSATPLAPPITQAKPGSRTNQKDWSPLSGVIVEDIEEMCHGQASVSSAGMEQRHINSIESTPGMEQRHTNTSGVEQRLTNTSGVEQRHTNSSDLESSWEAARLQKLRQQEAKEREERERVERELKSLEQVSSRKEEEQKEVSQEPEAQGMGGPRQEQGALDGCLEDKQSEESIDPVMLKYMELVQKRREQKMQPQTFTPAEPTESPLEVGEVTPSRASGADSAVDHSDHEDAFQDW